MERPAQARTLNEHERREVRWRPDALEQLHVLLLRAEADAVVWWRLVAVCDKVDEAVAQVADAIKHEPALDARWWLKVERHKVAGEAEQQEDQEQA